MSHITTHTIMVWLAVLLASRVILGIAVLSEVVHLRPELARRPKGGQFFITACRLALLWAICYAQGWL